MVSHYFIFYANYVDSKISLSLPQTFSAIGLIATIAGFKFIFNNLNICFLNVLTHAKATPVAGNGVSLLHQSE